MGIFNFHGQFHDESFDIAFPRVIAETTIPEHLAEQIRPVARALFDGGAGKKQKSIRSIKKSLEATKKALEAIIREGAWRWPAYEAQALDMWEAGLPFDGPAEVLFNRVFRLAYGLAQRERIKGTEDMMPYLMLDVPDERRARPECADMDGKARRVDDPYWNAHFPPCGWPDCQCGVIQVGDRFIKRDNIEVLPPSAFSPARPEHDITGNENRIEPHRLKYAADIERAARSKDCKWARDQLQTIAYTLVDESVQQEVSDLLLQMKADFTREDPLYRDAMAKLLPMVQANPGMIQSGIYKGQPDEIKEQIRSALYWADILGHIRREKKGSSYRLFPPENVT